MLYSFAKTLRKKYRKISPLYQLRRNSFFVNHVLPSLDIPIYQKLHGVNWKVKLRLLRNLSWVLNSRILSPELASLFLAIENVLHPKVFWDVGANIGFFSWLLKSKNQDLNIVLFESDPDNIALLQGTISTSKLTNVQLVDSAVSDEIGKAIFAIDKITGATGTLEISEQTFIQRQYGANPGFIEVNTVTLDHMWKQLGMHQPDLIKIDVEGSDKRVFDGATTLIRECRPIIVFECSSSTKQELISKLKSLDYFLFDADNINGSIDSAYNLLALPSHYAHLFNVIFNSWGAELKTYGITNK